MDSLKDALHDVKGDIDIVCINETFLDDNILSNEIAIDRFNVERRDRTRTGGGVCLYISNMYRYTRRYLNRSPERYYCYRSL